MHGYQHFISLAIYDSKKHNASSDVIMPLNGRFLFLGFIEAMSFLKLFFLLVNIWNDNFTGKYLKLRYKTILCHFKVDIKICLKIQKKFESISMINYLCIIHLLYIYGPLSDKTGLIYIYFSINIYNVIRMQGVSFLPTNVKA